MLNVALKLRGTRNAIMIVLEWVDQTEDNGDDLYDLSSHATAQATARSDRG